MSKASNAVLALSRAFYGKRLTQKQYDDLLGCKNINEIASYLRSSTVYSSAFEGVPAADFTARSLEDVIDRFRFDRFMSLCRYELAIGNDFYKYFLVKTETEQILRCTLLMLGNHTEEYMIQFGTFLDRHLSIDLYAMGKANSLEEIADALSHTPYESIYRKCLASPDRSYLTFELAFDSYFEKYQNELVERCFRSKEEKEVKQLICRTLDLSFLQKQLRIVDYYGGMLSVSNLVVPGEKRPSLLSAKQLEQITKAQSRQQITSVLEKSPYSKCVKESSEAGQLETALYDDLYTYCKKQVRFSTEPAAVVYCYLFLASNEVRNLVHITEGVKYGVSTDDIKNSLVGVGD